MYKGMLVSRLDLHDAVCSLFSSVLQQLEMGIASLFHDQLHVAILQVFSV